MPVDSKIISADGFSGNISLSRENGIHLKLSLTAEKPIAETDVIKVNLLSSSHPQLPPLNGGTADGNGKDFRLTKNIDNPHPYSADDIDTAEIILKNAFTDECSLIEKISFAEDYPDMDAIKEKLSFIQENEAYKAYLNMEEVPSPIETAEETLKDLYNIISPNRRDGTGKVYMEHLRKISDTLTKVAFPISGFSWYRCASPTPPVNASAVEHIIGTPAVSGSIEHHGHWILGIKEDADIICIAIPTRADAPNPLPHIDDCTVFIPSASPETEYCTVCISFEEDGQYFMGIC